MEEINHYNEFLLKIIENVNHDTLLQFCEIYSITGMSVYEVLENDYVILLESFLNKDSTFLLDLNELRKKNIRSIYYTDKNIYYLIKNVSHKIIGIICMASNNIASFSERRKFFLKKTLYVIHNYYKILLYDKSIKKLAYCNELTRLPNRRMLESKSKDILQSTSKVYVAFIDIDDFKIINDTFGHEAGDSLLKEIGSYFQSEDLIKPYIYHISGDEFVLFIDNVDLKIVTEITENIIKRFNTYWHVAKKNLLCTASIGVAVYPEDGSDYKSLVKKADNIMYEAKKSGKNKALFSKSCLGDVK